MNNGFYTVRAFYRKEGRTKYISHLDMNRCISRELKRSGLPVWHTLGFNPHIYVTFALPLSLGYESTCESFDFRLTEEMDLEHARTRLNAVLPEGLIVTCLALPQQKPEAIAWADYSVTLEYDGGAKKPSEAFRIWMDKPELLACKKTKSGEKEIDMKPHFSLRSFAAQENFLEIELRCAAGPNFNLNPTLLLEAFEKDLGIRADWGRIVRNNILQSDGSTWL